MEQVEWGDILRTMIVVCVLIGITFGLGVVAGSPGSLGEKLMTHGVVIVIVGIVWYLAAYGPAFT